MEDISFAEIGSIMKRRWWILATLLVFGAVLAGLFAYKLQSPRYVAFVTFVAGVQNEGGTLNASEFAVDQKVAPTIAQLVRSNSVRTKAIEESLSSNRTLSHDPRVNVSYTPPIIGISVEASSEFLATRVANEVVIVLRQRVAELYPDIEVHVLDPATAYAGMSPVFPHKHVEVALGALIGFMLGLVAMMLAESFMGGAGRDYNVPLEVPVLGMVPERRIG